MFKKIPLTFNHSLWRKFIVNFNERISVVVDSQIDFFKILVVDLKLLDVFVWIGIDVVGCHQEFRWN